MTRQPQLEDMVDAFIASALQDVHVAMPGRVTAYDASSRHANVKPLVKRVRIVDEERIAESLPIVQDVPVVFPGAGSYDISWPIASGDTVLIVCTSCSLERWLAGLGGEVDPQDPRRHRIGDAIAIPGLRSGGGSPTFGDRDSDLILESAGNIVAGGSSRLVTKEEFENHTHTAPGGATGVPIDPIVGTDKLRG